MRIRITAAATLSLLLAQATAATDKTAGNIRVLGDSAGLSAVSTGLNDGTPGGAVADGALGPVDHGLQSGTGVDLESGFFSRMVGTAAVDYYSAQPSSYSLSFLQSNPAGTTYEVKVSTWEMADPYITYFSTDSSGRPVEDLYPNTSFYNFVMANYMEGDYSEISSTVAVTRAAGVSSSTFRLEDVGHNTLAVSFNAFSNPGPVSGAAWTQESSLPFSRYGLASVVYGTHVFLSGGFTGAAASSAVYRAEFSPASGLGPWQVAGFMPEGLYGHQLLAARGRLYVLGGRTQTTIRDNVWSADISASGAIGAWSAEASLGMPLYFHAAAASGDWLYVSGGFSNSNAVSDIVYASRLGPAGLLGSWANSALLNGPRYAHGMAAAAGRLYVVGGRDTVAARSTVRIFGLDSSGALSGAPADGTPLPSPRYGHKLLASGNALYVLGGNNGSTVQSTVYVSTISAGISQSAPWALSAQAGFPQRQFAAGEALGGDLYLFGGAQGASARSEVFRSRLDGTSYLVEVSSAPDFSVDVRSSGWTKNYSVSFGDLQPAVTYYARAKAANRLGAESSYSAAAATMTYSALPGTAAWTSVGVTSATVNWLANGNPTDPLTDYEVQWSSSPDYLGAAPSVNGPILSYSIPSGLLPNTTYYARVKVLNSRGGPSRYADLPTAYTSFDPALDHSSPTYSMAMPAILPGWRSSNTFTCDVDIFDNGPTDSGLSYFEVKVSSTPGGLDGVWVPAVQDINQGAYTQDWIIPAAAWSGVVEGASNYFSLHLADRASNTTEYFDVFSVLADTTPPVLVSTFVPPAGLLTEAPVPSQVDSLRIDDPLSGIFKAQYSVSTNLGFADAAVVGWTDITTPPLSPDTTWYEPVFTYNFSQLANAPSNYFSFRLVDVAGSTRVYTSVFGIGKNVQGPIVNFSTPPLSAAYLSTFSYVAGVTAESNGYLVHGTEVSLYDTVGGRYFNGSDFLAGSKVWFDAFDSTPAFNYTFQNVPLQAGNIYQAVARSSDASGSYSQSFATRTFTYDPDPPYVDVAQPADGSSFSGAAALGSASDLLSGALSVDGALRRLSDGKWWDNSAWTAGLSTIALTGVSSWNWTFTPPLRDSLGNGASYYFTVRGTDKSLPPNSGPFGVYGSTFTYYDTTPPAATLTLAGGDGGMRGAVRLTWQTSADNGASGYLYSGAYRITYSTYSMTPASTAAVPGVTISTVNLTGGSTQTALITGLDAGTSYYFYLWTADDAWNWSPLSNEALRMASVLNSGVLSGNVADASTHPITGVLVEAFGPTGALEGSDNTDAFGNYAITGLASDPLTIRATWAADDIESSVSKDEVQNGASGVNFRLSTAYQLASIVGTIPAGFMPRAVARSAKASYTTRAVAPSASQPFVEIYRRGRLMGAALTDAGGYFEIPNLLPGTYAVRVFNGADYSRMESVALSPGQRFSFTPSFDLVNKDTVYAYPNPANTAVNFHFNPTAGVYEAQVEVFDIAGKLVKTLRTDENDPMVSGRRFAWNLAGDKVASGIYVYILRIKDASGKAAKPVAKKFAVIR